MPDEHLLWKLASIGHSKVRYNVLCKNFHLLASIIKFITIYNYFYKKSRYYCKKMYIETG